MVDEVFIFFQIQLLAVFGGWWAVLLILMMNPYLPGALVGVELKGFGEKSFCLRVCFRVCWRVRVLRGQRENNRPDQKGGWSSKVSLRCASRRRGVKNRRKVPVLL